MNKAVILILLLSTVWSGCARPSGKPDESLQRVRRAGVLRVAIDPSYPPFAFLDGTGQVVGYDADLSKELSSRLGVRVNFVGVEVTSVFDALIARKADVAVSAVSPAWEYAKDVAFSKSYFNAGQVFVTRADGRQVIRPADLTTDRLGVEIGSTGELEGRNLAQLKPGISLMPLDSLESAFSALSSGKVDAVIGDRVTAAVLLRDQKGLRIAGEPFTDEPYVVVAPASDRSLLSEINGILETMQANGALTELERRWVDGGS